MAKITVNGIGIGYEIIGTGDKTAIITPGGRFPKETPGVRELAEALAPHGFKTIIWDRPNCGESDVNFDAETESVMNADALAGLLKALNFGPSLIIGGSAGARVSLLAAIRHPEAAAGLFLLWVSGGAVGLATLAVVYCADNISAAITKGMSAVAELPAWSEQIRRNPANRDRILAQDPEKFIETMQLWAGSFFPKSDAPVPGLNPAELAAIKVPVVVLRSGTTDMYHTRATSEALAGMLPTAQLQEPPWGNDEWIESMARPGPALFASWPKLVPQVLELAKKAWK